MLKVPVRGIDAGCRRNGCGAEFAIAVVDFEPAAAYELVDAAPHPPPTRRDWMTDETWAAILATHAEDLRSFKDAFGGAMRRELGRVPVRVVLTRLRYHETDSSEKAFALAARRAARELYRRIPCRLREPVRGVQGRETGTYFRGDPFTAGITVDFEPADEFAFASRIAPRRIPEDDLATVREVFRLELGTQPVRVVLVDEVRENVTASRLRDVAHRTLGELRAHLRPGE